MKIPVASRAAIFVMNPLDWLLATTLAYSVIRAFMRGLLREALALGGLIAGFFLACWNYSNLAERLHSIIGQRPLADLAAFLLILIATLLVATLLGKLLSRTASAVGLGFLDRLGGACFGLARGAMLDLALLLAITALLPVAPWLQTQLQTSSLATYFFQADHAVSFGMPSDLRQRLTNGLDRIRTPRIF